MNWKGEIYNKNGKPNVLFFFFKFVPNNNDEQITVVLKKLNHRLS